MISVPAGYERPSVQSSTSGSSNGLSQSGSLKFAAGACYENPNGLGFYENPLAAPKAPTRNDSLERHPGYLLDSSLYENPSSPTSASGNEWFCLCLDLAVKFPSQNLLCTSFSANLA